jgi:hypothetical protein
MIKKIKKLLIIYKFFIDILSKIWYNIIVGEERRTDGATTQSGRDRRGVEDVYPHHQAMDLPGEAPRGQDGAQVPFSA